MQMNLKKIDNQKKLKKKELYGSLNHLQALVVKVLESLTETPQSLQIRKGSLFLSTYQILTLLMKRNMICESMS